MSQYCHHGAAFSYDQAHKQTAPDGWQAREVWVCDQCGKINHAVQEEQMNVRGPQGAVALLSTSGQSTGIHKLVWSTPNGHAKTIEYFPYPRTIPMSHPEPLLFSLWELLQSKVAVILDGKPTQNSSDMEYQGWMAAKAQARGIAEALAILMKPFIETADDVVRHAVAYHKDNSYVVPGLGTHLWDPLHNPDGSLRTPAPVKRAPTAAVKKSAPPKPPSAPASKALSEADIAFVKASAEMFSAEDLASMMKVSVSVIEKVLA